MTMRIGTWNIQVMATKDDDVFIKTKKYKTDIVELRERRKKTREHWRNKIRCTYTVATKRRKRTECVSVAIHIRYSRGMREIKSWDQFTDRSVQIERQMKHSIVIIM